MTQAYTLQELQQKRLPRSFYDRKADIVARDLLGKWLVHITNGIQQIGRIVEVEAYLGEHDKAAHSCKGLTPRTKVMFGAPGYAYVYLIYGIYHCANIVTESEGRASAVLLRALEPIANISSRTQGPGLLCRALNINKSLNEHDLLSDNFFVTEPLEQITKIKIVKRPRIGVDYAGEWAAKLLRFYIQDNKFISKK